MALQVAHHGSGQTSGKRAVVSRSGDSADHVEQVDEGCCIGEVGQDGARTVRAQHVCIESSGGDRNRAGARGRGALNVKRRVADDNDLGGHLHVDAALTSAFDGDRNKVGHAPEHRRRKRRTRRTTRARSVRA